MNLLPTIFGFTISPLNIFWSIVAVYVTSFIITYSIYLFKLTRLPAFRPLTKVYKVFLNLARGDTGVFRDLIEETEYLFQEHGYTVIWFIFLPFLMIGRYDSAQEIVGDPATLDKGFPFEASETFFGQGIIASKDEKWKSRRRLVRQQFSPLSIPHYVDTVRSIALDVHQSIEKSIENQAKSDKPLDIRGFFSIATMQMIVGKAAGVKLTEKEYLFLCSAMEKFLHEVDKRVVFPPFYFESIYEIYLKLSGVRAMIDRTNEILVSAIRSKYNEIRGDFKVKSTKPVKADAAGYEKLPLIETERNNNLSDPKDDSSQDEDKKRANSLSEFLMRTWVKPETGLTAEIEDAILEEMKSVIVAGSDGPDSLMTWFLYILGCNPEYQEKIYQEVKDIDLKDWTMSTVNNCQFLDQCFKEAARLYASVPIKIRRTEKDQIVDGKVLPKGTLIIVSLVNILRDPKIFPQSSEYKPERFDPDATHKIPTGAYIPFGIRPRDCIGQRLGPFYIKFVIGSIIKSFKIKSHRHWKDINYKVIFVFKPTDPLNVTFSRR